MAEELWWNQEGGAYPYCSSCLCGKNTMVKVRWLQLKEMIRIMGQLGEVPTIWFCQNSRHIRFSEMVDCCARLEEPFLHNI